MSTRSCASRVACGLVALAALAAGPNARTAPGPTPAGVPGTGQVPGLRLGSSEFASEAFELVARFDSGHRLFLEVLVTNIGVGDRNAAVIGHVIAPDGRVQRFRKAKREGEWTLSPDGLRIALGSIVFDRSETRRFAIDKRLVKIDLALGPPRPAVAWPPSDAAFGLELLQASGEVTGSLWTDGMATPIAVRGTAALVHRWSDGLESRQVARRIELFAPAGDTGVYYVELSARDAPARRWIVVERAGRVLRESEAFTAPPAQGPLALPRALALDSPGLAGRATLGAELLRFDPLQDLKAPLRAVVRLVIQPESIWSAADLALDLRPEGDAQASRIIGPGFANVMFYEPPENARTGDRPADEGRTACASAY
jgi:hypothetical protein